MTKEEAIKILRHWGSNTPAIDRDCAVKMAIEALEKPEPHEIGYNECANALLKMWMDNVMTDGEYNRIADKLNEKWGKTELPEPFKGVNT